MKPFACFVMWLIASTAFAQFEYAQTQVDIIEAIESVSTDEFAPNEGNLLTHFVEDHQGERLLRKLHEYLHQRIERLRPAGAHSYVVMEATQEEYDAFMQGVVAQEMLQGNWIIVRQDRRPGQRIANFVAIGKTHYSHIGLLTREALQRIVDKATPRMKAQPFKWKISRIVMHTQPNCTPCDDWRRRDEKRAVADGVVFDTDGHGGRSTPWFEVQYCRGDQCKSLVFGNVSYETMKAAM